MKTGHVADELAAYMDGEAKDPDRIARHLAECPVCAQEHEALVRLSAHVRSLNAPEVRPAFVTRVMAEIREGRAAPRPWWIRFGIPLAGVAVVVVVLIGAVLSLFAPGAVNPPGPGVAENVVRSDEAAVLAEMERRLSQEPAATFWDMDGLFGAEDSGDVATDDLLASLSDTDWFNALAGAWDDEDDVDALIRTLDANEIRTLVELIRVYEKEGRVL